MTWSAPVSLFTCRKKVCLLRAEDAFEKIALLIQHLALILTLRNRPEHNDLQNKEFFECPPRVD